VWSRETRNPVLIAVLVVLLVGVGLLAGIVGVGFSVLLMGVVLAAGVVTFLTLASRRIAAADARA
jgi:hypothetical protein